MKQCAEMKTELRRVVPPFFARLVSFRKATAYELFKKTSKLI